jgi:hypothetical protein
MQAACPAAGVSDQRGLGLVLVPPILSKFYYAKRRFSITSKYRQMHGILNVDEIKN